MEEFSSNYPEQPWLSLKFQIILLLDLVISAPILPTGPNLSLPMQKLTPDPIQAKSLLPKILTLLSFIKLTQTNSIKLIDSMSKLTLIPISTISLKGKVLTSLRFILYYLTIWWIFTAVGTVCLGWQGLIWGVAPVGLAGDWGERHWKTIGLLF